jgi:5-methylcytosine-specific restriction protein A
LVPSRKVEQFSGDAFELGKRYSRPQIAQLGQVAELANAREWGGYVEFANEIHIYVTLHKTRNEPEHMYRDRIEEDIVFWDSRAKHTQESLQVKKLLAADRPIRFFCRIDDREPFVHCGKLEHVHHEGTEPVEFQWRLLAYATLRSMEAFERLEEWTPEGAPPPATSSDHVARRELAFREGWAVQIAVNRYERDPDARDACLAHHGYACWVCQFEFRTIYGSLGDQFAFVHHRRPIAQRAAEGPYDVDPRHDLVPICGNCHAMVHRSIEPGQPISAGTLSATSWRRLLTLRAEVRRESWDQP